MLDLPEIFDLETIHQFSLDVHDDIYVMWDYQ